MKTLTKICCILAILCMAFSVSAQPGRKMPVGDTAGILILNGQVRMKVYHGQTWDKLVIVDEFDSVRYSLTLVNGIPVVVQGKPSYLGDAYYSLLGANAVLQLRGGANNIVMGPNPNVTTPVGTLLGTIGFNANNTLNNGDRTSASITATKTTSTGSRNASVNINTGSGGSNIVVVTASPNGVQTRNQFTGRLINQPDTAPKALHYYWAPDGYTLPYIVMQGFNGITQPYIQITDFQGNLKFKVDTGGNVYQQHYAYPQFRTVTGNTTVTGYDYIIYANTSTQSITVTLPTGLDSGTRVIIKKTSPNNSVIITPASGTINGLASISYTEERQVTLHYTKPDWQSDFYSTAASFSRTLTIFGAKADLRRLVVNTTASSATVTASTGTFSATDVGKYIAIKAARDNSGYSALHNTLTAKIIGYTNSGTVTIDTTADYSTTGTDAYSGTDNYAAIQSALDYCAANKIGILLADQPGIYGVFPKQSATAIAQTDKGFHITAPIWITGAGKGVTAIKWCIEDDMNVTYASEYNSSGFIVYCAGHVKLSDFTALAPDRFRTEYVTTGGMVFLTYKTGLAYDITGSITLKDIDVIGDSTGKDANYKLQWSECLAHSADAGTTGGWFDVNLINVRTQVNVNAVTVFSDDAPNKLLYIRNMWVEGSGCPKMTTVLGNHANVTNGSTTLTISGITNFSFYDFTTQYTTDNRKYYVWVISGTDTLKTKISSITNPTTAVLDDAATFTGTNLQIIAFPLSGFGENHGFYIHPNVTIDIDWLGIVNCNKYAFHVYSGGGVPGEPKYRIFRHCGNYRISPDYNVYCDGWLIGHGSAVTNRVYDCDSFQYTPYNQPLPVEAYNTRFTAYQTMAQGKFTAYNCQFNEIWGYNSDTTNLHNCTANFVGRISGIVNVWNSTVKWYSPSDYIHMFNTVDSNGLLYALNYWQLREYSITTTNSTPATIATIAVPTGKKLIIVADVTGYNAADVVRGIKTASIQNVSGTLTIAGGSATDQAATMSTAGVNGAVFNITTSGTNAIVTVTGIAATTINWQASVKYRIY